MASLLWDIGRQYSPRCDAAERSIPSGAILFPYRNFVEKRNKIIKSPAAPKNESGLTQLISMGESICQIWVKLTLLPSSLQDVNAQEESGVHL